MDFTHYAYLGFDEAICKASIDFIKQKAEKHCFSFAKCNRVTAIFPFLMELRLEYDDFIRSQLGLSELSRSRIEDLIRACLKEQRWIRKQAVDLEKFEMVCIFDLLDYQLKEIVTCERKGRKSSVDFYECLYLAITSVNKHGKVGNNLLEFLPLKVMEYTLSHYRNGFIRSEQEERTRLREEQKALKELKREKELAEKDAQKARTAIEKNEAALAKAKTDEQVRKLQSQIEELKIALQRAEERRERAISMAQQTRCGYVYVISNIGSFGEGVYKIGMTRRIDPMQRVRELGDASVPFPFDVHAMIYTEDAPGLESHLHKVFDLYKLNAMNWRKEYFRVSLANIREEVEKCGIQCHWKETADAIQYRDSLWSKEIGNMDAAELEQYMKEHPEKFSDTERLYEYDPFEELEEETE